MAPIVHGLEQRYGSRMDFLYLDVQDPRTAEAKQRLGFDATPHFFILDRSGRIRGEWKGVTGADTLRAGIEAALAEGS
jgi:hypothetical protein